MAILDPAIASDSYEASAELIQRMSSPGNQCIRLDFLTDLNALAVPANSNRIYLSFSLVQTTGVMIVTPSSSVYGAGFVLDQNNRTVEFAGQLLSPMVSCEWRCVGNGTDQINVIAINRE